MTKESGGRSTVSSRYSYIRDGLVVAEVALAFVLAFGAAGVMRELGRLARIDSGMITSNVITLHLTPRVPDHDYYAIEERVAALPGVRAAGFIQMVPLQNWDWLGDFHITGTPRENRPTVELRTVTPGYFKALGIPVRGRVVTEADAVGEGACDPDQRGARARAFSETSIRSAARRIAARSSGWSATSARRGSIARPFRRSTRPVNRDAGIASDLGMSLIVSTSGSPEAIVPAVRAAVREVNPVLAIFNVKTMDQVVSDSLWELNLYRWLIGLFAALALVLATIGLYGVIWYGVSSRSREFAVRLALGSDPAGLARLVLVRGARLATIGLVLGAIGALSLLPLLERTPGERPSGRHDVCRDFGLLMAIAFCRVPRTGAPRGRGEPRHGAAARLAARLLRPDSLGLL